MFRLPDPPSPKSEVHELADYAELLCWKYGLASKREIVAYLGRVDENEHNYGVDDDDDSNSDFLDEVMNEVERRASACNNGYPFILSSEGTVLRHNADNKDEKSIIYRYLLLSTRLNMRDHRDHGGIDGAILLEEITAQVLKNYIGGKRARALVFGTATAGSFENKVNMLCQELREGTGFLNRDEAPTQAVDGRLDAVAWVPFADSLPGQLILFGQCKTGSSWSKDVSQLQPDAFIKKWMRDPILIDPVRVFCLSEAVKRSRWKSISTDAGILFDRCRLVDFCENVDPRLLERVSTWTLAAKEVALLTF